MLAVFHIPLGGAGGFIAPPMNRQFLLGLQKVSDFAALCAAQEFSLQNDDS